jgi:hypothetical protein
MGHFWMNKKQLQSTILQMFEHFITLSLFHLRVDGSPIDYLVDLSHSFLEVALVWCDYHGYAIFLVQEQGQQREVKRLVLRFHNARVHG